MSAPLKYDERDDMLAAEYALGTLPHGERRAFEQRLLTDAQLRDRVAWWDQHLLPMGDEIAPVEAPASVLAKIEDRLFTSTTARHSWWESLGFWRGLSIASLAGLIIFGGLYANNLADVSSQETDIYIAQVAGETSDVKLAAVYNAENQTLKIKRLGGQEAENRSFELWVIAGDNAPVSLGLLSADDSFDVAVPTALQAALSSNAILAVSDEPAGGSPTGQPTGAVLATGQIIGI